MQPSKEQWEEIAKQLDRQHDPVYLRCDGYLVHASMQRTEKNKLAIVVYVNGIIKWGWMDGEADEPRRFWRESKRTKMSAKDLKFHERLLGKRDCRKLGYYDKVSHWTPLWSRPMPLIRQLKKMNESIEVIDYDTHSAELEKLKETAGE